MADSPHLHVEFYTTAVENPAKTRAEGRPIYEDAEMIKILIAGDPKNTLIAPAHSSPSRNPDTGMPMTYAEKFPEHYRYFKDNQDQQRAEGTPLSEAPWLSEAKRSELKALKIYTVDALAMLDGTALQRLGMGGRSLKEQAQAWLDRAAGAAADARLSSELAARDEQIRQMQAQIEAMVAGNAAPAPAKADNSVSPFDAWQDEDLKVWITDATGSRPLGNPSHKTLVSRCDEINAELEAKRKAA